MSRIYNVWLGGRKRLSQIEPWQIKLLTTRQCIRLSSETSKEFCHHNPQVRRKIQNLASLLYMAWRNNGTNHRRIHFNPLRLPPTQLSPLQLGVDFSPWLSTLNVKMHLLTAIREGALRSRSLYNRQCSRWAAETIMQSAHLGYFSFSALPDQRAAKSCKRTCLPAI